MSKFEVGKTYIYPGNRIILSEHNGIQVDKVMITGIYNPGDKSDRINFLPFYKGKEVNFWIKSFTSDSIMAETLIPCKDQDQKQEWETYYQINGYYVYPTEEAAFEEARRMVNNSLEEHSYVVSEVRSRKLKTFRKKIETTIEEF